MDNNKGPLIIVTERKEKPFYSEITHAVKQTTEERTYMLLLESKDFEEQMCKRINMEDKVFYPIEEGYKGFFVINENELKNFKYEEHAKKAKINQLKDTPVMVTKRSDRIYIYSKDKSYPWKFKTNGEFLEQATFADNDMEHLGYVYNHDEINTRKLSRKNNR